MVKGIRPSFNAQSSGAWEVGRLPHHVVGLMTLLKDDHTQAVAVVIKLRSFRLNVFSQRVKLQLLYGRNILVIILR